MTALLRTLADPVTYRRLCYLVLEVPLATIWFTFLVTIWSLCFGLAVTPLVIPAALLLAAGTRAAVTVEAQLARALLGVDARVPTTSIPGGSLRARARAMFGPGFWRAQGYLWTRWFLAFPAGTLQLGLVGWAISMVVAPLWMPFLHAGTDVYGLHVHGFLEHL